MTVRERMLHDHEQLERSFKELESVVEGANAPTLVERWTAFERRVKAHFDAEERHLLPRLEDAHPNEVAELRREHEDILTRVADLGVRVDLHTLRQDAATDLLQRLRDHAKREDDALYRWADELGDPSLGERLLDALARQGRNVL
ncbi:MAG: hemerythrin domain-containing protein [Myxococcales bacterium]|nr:hemerythrin domain-containing protein [Myxococcales bacterium]MCB9576740.1 hemerythrin domain-containing protein [Polyangiaceae bacterium]